MRTNTNRVGTWRDKAVEIALKTLATKPQVVNPAWQIQPEELEDVTIRWPVHYQWPRAHLWVDTLLYGFRSLATVQFAQLAQPYKGMVIFQFVVHGKSHEVAIDYSDYSEVNEEIARHFPLYFKMQHRREGYDLNNVLPGGYVPDGRRIYLHLASLRRIRERRDFAFDVYGRFSLEFARQIRQRAVEILSAQNVFQFTGGLTKVNYIDFLKEVARARICIDLPGEGDFCHRLINYFAIGSCVVAPRHRNILNAPLVDGEHIAYVKEDLSDLVEVCKFYLENEEARERMSLKSRRFFEENLHKDNLTAYYLRSCLDRLQN